MHPLDRLMIRIRRPLIATLLFTVPASLVFYMYGIRLLFDVLPAWVCIAGVACHLVMVIGLLALDEHQRENR